MNKNKKVEDYFQVEFFDPSLVLDAKVRDLLNAKLRDIKSECDLKLIEFKAKLNIQDEQCKNLQKALLSLQKQQDLATIVKQLFLIENDPYKIWKQFQDVVGNQFFFQIFEKQETGYEINYKEIDTLILKSNANKRDYENHKNAIEQSFHLLVNQTHEEMKVLKQELQQKNEQIKQMEASHSKALEDLRVEIKNSIEAQWAEREKKIKLECDERIINIYRKFTNKTGEDVINKFKAKIGII